MQCKKIENIIFLALDSTTTINLESHRALLRARLFIVFMCYHIRKSSYSRTILSFINMQMIPNAMQLLILIIPDPLLLWKRHVWHHCVVDSNVWIKTRGLRWHLQTTEQVQKPRSSLIFFHNQLFRPSLSTTEFITRWRTSCCTGE